MGSALRKISKIKAERLDTHLIFASPYYDYHEDRMKSFILEGMEKYKMKSVMVTIIDLSRLNLITKEVMEDIYMGKNYTHYIRQCSINDDLESFFEDLRLGKQPLELCWTYFLPKLTKEKLKAIEIKDPTYLASFSVVGGKDVPEAQMKLSESDSKFVEAFGMRRTFTINNPSRCSLQ